MLKRRNFVYVSDRGQEFEIEEMQSSHLMNAIHHHQKQYRVVNDILTGGNYAVGQMENLQERMEALGETIITLEQELASRSLEDDSKREVDNGNTYHRY